MIGSPTGAPPRPRALLDLLLPSFALIVIALASPPPGAFCSSLPRVSLDIECHSGTPPVLEFVLAEDGEDGARVDASGGGVASTGGPGNPRAEAVEEVAFDFEGDGSIDFRVDDVRKGVVFRGVPYRRKGTYLPRVILKTPEGVVERRFRVSFIDFQWGRDNYKFANDGPFENAVDFVSKTVLDWAEARFGELDARQEMLVLYSAYRTYRGSFGRCYGFTGLQQFALERPGTIPLPYRSVYGIEERDAEVIAAIDWLQNDMVFANFVSGGKAFEGPVRLEELEAELDAVEESIVAGMPVIFGYVGKDLHHSMLVYGFFEDLLGGKTTLLAANNWIRDQSDNTYSEDAENIVVDFSDEESPARWFDLTKKRERRIERFFAVRREEEYSLSGADFFAMLENAERRVAESGKIVVMVENAEEAYVVGPPGGDRGGADPDGLGAAETAGGGTSDWPRTGFVKGQRVLGWGEAGFKRIDYNYLFELPLDTPSTLVLNKRIFNRQRVRYKDVNIYCIVPSPAVEPAHSGAGAPAGAPAPGFTPYVFTGVPVPFLAPLRVSITRNGPSWER